MVNKQAKHKYKDFCDFREVYVGVFFFPNKVTKILWNISGLNCCPVVLLSCAGGWWTTPDTSILGIKITVQCYTDIATPSTMPLTENTSLPA